MSTLKKILKWLSTRPLVIFIGGLLVSLLAATLRTNYWRNKAAGQVKDAAADSHEAAGKEAKSVERQLAAADKKYQEATKKGADAMMEASKAHEEREAIAAKYRKLH